MVCAGVMLACALISSNLGTRWDAWASGPHVYATLQQGGCTSGIRTQTHCLLARGSGRRQKNCMFVFCGPLAAAYECWSAELHLMPHHLRLKNPAQILVPTRPRCTTSEGLWLNPDLVGKWSHSPALPFLPQAQTSITQAQTSITQAQTSMNLILNPSANSLCLVFRDLCYMLIFLARLLVPTIFPATQRLSYTTTIPITCYPKRCMFRSKNISLMPTILRCDMRAIRFSLRTMSLVRSLLRLGNLIQSAARAANTTTVSSRFLETPLMVMPTCTTTIATIRYTKM